MKKHVRNEREKEAQNQKSLKLNLPDFFFEQNELSKN